MSKLPFPEAVLSQHVLALGKTGSGKSSKLRVAIEWILDRDSEPPTIVDAKGDWWGLKSSADGKRPGYPIVIFGGEHADVPINQYSGAHVAELVATGNRPSLIDLGGWMVGERTRFFIEFASHYFRLARGKRYLVLPEVHNFAPQGKVMDPDAGKMLHWTNRLASEGRGRGITILADSQRPQKVHKDFVTSCETLIACRVVHKLDRDAIKDWIDGCADPVAGKLVLSELPQMQRTDAWVWSPEIGFGPERITFAMFKTYDSFKPQAADHKKLAGWADVDLDDVKAKLATVVEESKANDPKALRARIVELETEMRGQTFVTSEDPDAAYDRGHNAGYAEGIDAGVDIAWKDIGKEIDGMIHVVTKVGEAADQAVQFMSKLHALAVTKPRPTGARPENPNAVVVKDAPPGGSPRGSRTGTALAVPRARQIDVRAPSTAGQTVTQRVLNALAELEQMGAQAPERELVAFMAGYSNVRSTGFANGIAEAQAGDLITTPEAGKIALTSQGRRQARPAARAKTPEELQARVVAMLGGASARVLEPLIRAYPRGVAREGVAAAAGYSNVRSTGFAEAMARLTQLGFVHVPSAGVVAAAPVLFMEAR